MQRIPIFIAFKIYKLTMGVATITHQNLVGLYRLPEDSEEDKIILLRS